MPWIRGGGRRSRRRRARRRSASWAGPTSLVVSSPSAPAEGPAAGSGRDGAGGRGGVEVIGKTGTAEFGEDDPPATHAWFIGGANGLGFAVLLEGGGVGGRDAAPLASRFLEQLSQ